MKKIILNTSWIDPPTKNLQSIPDLKAINSLSIIRISPGTITMTKQLDAATTKEK